MATTTRTRKIPIKSYEEVVEELGIKIVSAAENDNLFENIIGLNSVKKHLAQSLEIFLHPEDPKYKKATLYRNFFFSGDIGSGRALMAYAFAKAANLPIVVINSEKFVAEDCLSLIKGLKTVLEKHHPAVFLFKKFEYINSIEKSKIFIYSKIRDYLNLFSDSFFFASILPYSQLSDIIHSKDAFCMKLEFDDPDLNQREALFRRMIAEYPYDANINFSKIAKDTLGMNAGTISILLANAYNQALRDGKDVIDFESIDAVLSSDLYGDKKKVMTEKERRLTAIHESGHVIAGYFSSPDYKISKVEIAHRAQTLGLTISEDDEDKLTYFKKDFEANIYLCFGGMAAERICFGENSSGVSEDLKMATMTAEAMVKNYGMNDEFGPISIAKDLFETTCETLEEQADLIVQVMLRQLYNATERLMLKHKDALDALVEALLEKETLYTAEIMEILKKHDTKD